MKKHLFALAAAALVTSAAPTLPAVAQSRSANAGMSASDRAAVNQASAYLQGLTGARGRFVQTDARGAVTKGNYYLLRRTGLAADELEGSDQRRRQQGPPHRSSSREPPPASTAFAPPQDEQGFIAAPQTYPTAA